MLCRLAAASDVLLSQGHGGLGTCEALQSSCVGSLAARPRLSSALL